MGSFGHVRLSDGCGQRQGRLDALPRYLIPASSPSREVPDTGSLPFASGSTDMIER